MLILDIFPLSLSTIPRNHLPFNSMLKVPIYYLAKPPSIIRLQQSWLTTTLSFILIYMLYIEAICQKSLSTLYYLEKPTSIIRLQQSWLTTTLSFIFNSHVKYGTNLIFWHKIQNVKNIIYVPTCRLVDTARHTSQVFPLESVRANDTGHLDPQPQS